MLCVCVYVCVCVSAGVENPVWLYTARRNCGDWQKKHKVGVVSLSQICRGFVAWKEKETILVRISYFYLLLNFGHEE
jgi:hypothetical protein